MIKKLLINHKLAQKSKQNKAQNLKARGSIFSICDRSGESLQRSCAKIFLSRRGEGYIDYVIGLFCILLVVGFVVTLMPVFTAKQQLDTFAVEIVREAEIKGSTSVSSRISTMREQTGLDPNIEWDCGYFSGNKVQLNGDITAILTETVDIGFFTFGSFPIELTAKATGKSEVYYK